MTIIVSDNVRSCVARGVEYTLGRPFSFMDGCIRYNCECHDDGSWECPADRAEDTCQHGRDRQQPTTDHDPTGREPTKSEWQLDQIFTAFSQNVFINNCYSFVTYPIFSMINIKINICSSFEDDSRCCRYRD